MTITIPQDVQQNWDLSRQAVHAETEPPFCGGCAETVKWSHGQWRHWSEYSQSFFLDEECSPYLCRE